MSEQKNISRRDFLKLGGLASIVLPSITTIGQMGNYDLLESKETFGGFTIQKLKDDDPLFEFGPNYTRFDATNVILSRTVWDKELIAQEAATAIVYEKNDPGYTQVDKAIAAGAAYCAMFEGTGSGGMGIHDGLLGLDPKVGAPFQGPTFEGRWEHDHLSSKEVTAIVKKASLFLGASLVGITDLNEKWLYSHYYEGGSQTRAPIQITKIEKVELPDGQVSIEEARQLIKTKFDKLRLRIAAGGGGVNDYVQEPVQGGVTGGRQANERVGASCIAFHKSRHGLS